MSKFKEKYIIEWKSRTGETLGLVFKDYEKAKTYFMENYDSLDKIEMVLSVLYFDKYDSFKRVKMQVKNINGEHKLVVA